MSWPDAPCDCCGSIEEKHEPDCTYGCMCGSGLDPWPEYDAQGIYLCKVCPECRDKQLSKYRPEILTGYDQSDVDEPIE